MFQELTDHLVLNPWYRQGL